MRASGQWLCALDDRIMDHLAATARSSPAAMAAEPLADVTRELIDERCRILARVGFLVLTYGGTYELTMMGLRYLDGELDPTLLKNRATDREGLSSNRQ
jgi:hypothetical protein